MSEQSKRHVALLMSSVGGGGAERVMLTLAEEFVKRGVRVDLVVCRAKGPLLDDVSDDVNVINLGAERGLVSLPKLVRFLRKRKPRVLLSAMRPANVLALAARGLSRVETRIVVSEHSTLSA